MANPVIEINQLSFSYSGSIVLSDVTFSIGEKEFVAVIGPNGGGKTTLIKLMLGLLTPGSGKIKIFNKSPKTASHRIGYVPQDVAINKSFPISVIDVVLMGRLRRHRWASVSKKDKIAAKNALDCLEMLEFQNYKIDDLSGGQRERVFIARALATDPDMLILDEPTANIDSHGKRHLYALLKDLNKTKTIIVVSHDTMVLSSYVTSVACINRSAHYHDDSEITDEMLDMSYQCPVELIAHGIPHRILKTHKDK